MEGEGIRKFFKGVYNKVLKPVGKKIIANPGRALQIATQLGALQLRLKIQKLLEWLACKLVSLASLAKE